MNKHQILQETSFKAVRSSGPGGQHVNKVSTKIVLSFDLKNSQGLTDTEKGRALRKLSNRLSKDGVLTLQCDETRSQHQNKHLATSRLLLLLQQSIAVPKYRKTTKPSRSTLNKRKASKQRISEKKKNRKKPLL